MASFNVLSPRITINSLPSELKAQITRMAQAQDGAHNSRDCSYAETFRELYKTKGHPLYGNSLRMLGCVSREWRELATAIDYESLGSQGCRMPIFSSHILKQYGRFVKIAYFAEEWHPTRETEGDLASLFSALPLLPHLTSLHFMDEAWGPLFGQLDPTAQPFDPPTAEQSLRRTVLLTWIAPRITYLTPGNFHGLSARTLLEVLPAFRHLTSLDFTVDDTLDSDVDPLAAALVSCSALTSLSISGCLAITLQQDLDESMWRFAMDSRQTLQRLSITLRDLALVAPLLADRSTSKSFKPPSFPSLTTLSLDAQPQDLTSLLRLLPPPPRALDLAFNLRELVRAQTLPADPFTPTLNLVLNSPSLKKITIGAQDFASGVDLLLRLGDHLRTLLAQSNIQWHFEQKFDLITEHVLRCEARDDDDDEQQQQLSTAQLTTAADQLLRDGLAFSAQVRAVGDQVGARTLTSALLELNALVLRHKD